MCSGSIVSIRIPPVVLEFLTILQVVKTREYMLVLPHSCPFALIAFMVVGRRKRARPSDCHVENRHLRRSSRAMRIRTETLAFLFRRTGLALVKSGRTHYPAVLNELEPQLAQFPFALEKPSSLFLNYQSHNCSSYARTSHRRSRMVQ